MCLAVVAINARADLPLLALGNRDEFHQRPTDPLHWWSDAPDVVAGRDREAGGTWFAAGRDGRFGLITNVREPAATAGGRSRGELIPAFLNGGDTAAAFADGIRGDDYAGFNLLIGETGGPAVYVSNRDGGSPRPLGDGIVAVSNALLDTPWPKLVRVREAIREWLARDDRDDDEIFAILRDREPGLDDPFPAGELDPALARALSAPFVVGERYGTRSTTLLAINRQGIARIRERRFAPGGEVLGADRCLRFALNRDSS
ncbi:MAG: NRDE family protein [Pseudomonadota bacterium]